MNSTTVAVDLAKNVFEVAVTGSDWKVTERHRLSRARFVQFFVHRPPCRVVMEACGSAHHWARELAKSGHQVELLPAQYVRAYVRRNKTDRADAAALLEAARCADLRPVPVKTIEQQQIQSLHRLRSQWLSTRHRYVNALRGSLREFGVVIPIGVHRAKEQIGLALAEADNGIPTGLRPTLFEMLTEVRALEDKIAAVERELDALTRSDARVRQLQDIPGIGLLTGTALRAAVGDIQRFPSGRHFASWIASGRSFGRATRNRLSAATRSAASEPERAQRSWGGSL
jgi:transposase